MKKRHLFLYVSLLLLCCLNFQFNIADLSPLLIESEETEINEIKEIKTKRISINAEGFTNLASSFLLKPHPIFRCDAVPDFSIPYSVIIACKLFTHSPPSL